MLKRIASIKGIGSYASCAAGPVEFRKTSLIFGYNSYGKSTLCEVLRSLETGDTEEVRARETIPGPAVQQATLTFAENGKSESTILLKDGKWIPSSPLPFKLHVFDSGFVSRNLFTGNRAERSNREALSRFVLGEQGVRQANEIADMRKSLATARASLKKLNAQLQAFGNVDNFVNLDVTQSEEELTHVLRPKIVLLEKVKTSLGEVQKIQARPVINEPATPTGTPLMIERLNVALQHTLQNTHAAARARLEEHVQRHMRHHSTSQGWLRQGLDQFSGITCPFCEQPVSGAPEGLLDAYRQFFDEAFDRQSEALLSDLDAFERALQRWDTAADNSDFEKSALVLSEYRELEGDEQFIALKARFDQLGAAISDAASDYRQVLHPLREEALAAIRRKRGALQEKIAPLEYVGYQDAHTVLVAAVRHFRDHVEQINSALIAFKQKSDRASLDAEVARLTREIAAGQFLLRRVTTAATCNEYKVMRDLDDQLSREIGVAEEALVREQSEYLQKFFARINLYFSKFGSRHFSIAIAEKLDMQGYQPVLSLIVKYHGVVIEPQRLGAVFSESDRRALALSVFWAKLSILSDADRALAIAVLDDPVTSFDDNRISAAVMQMRLEGVALRQLIVLTHYHAFARHWLGVERVSGTMGFHRLTKNDITSGLEDGDPDEFLHSEQQKLFRKFVDYIEGRAHEPIGMELRVFLENEVRDRYRQQLAEGGVQSAQLSDVIEYLRVSAVIGGAIATKAHALREALNGPHHVLEARGREDWASLACEMLNFIYTEL